MTAKDIYEAFRKALAELLIPEIKELQNRVSSLEERINERFISLEKRIDERFTSLEKEIVKIHEGQKAILDKLDIAQRVAKLEAVVENIQKKVA